MPETTYDKIDLSKRLRAECNGHPHAKIKWPHRILHEAADEIDRLTSAPERARKAVEGMRPAGSMIYAYQLNRMIDRALSALDSANSPVDAEGIDNG